MHSSSEALIKTDETGRVRTPAVRRESLLEEFDRSGLSGPKFAALAGIKYQTFATWVRKRRAGQSGEGATLPAKPVVAGPWWEAVVEQRLGLDYCGLKRRAEGTLTPVRWHGLIRPVRAYAIACGRYPRRCLGLV